MNMIKDYYSLFKLDKFPIEDGIFPSNLFMLRSLYILCSLYNDQCLNLIKNNTSLNKI